MTVLRRQPKRPPLPATEAAAQDALCLEFIRQRRHCVTVPNTHVFYWESDLLSVTESMVVHEFEIKVSRSDLMRELVPSQRSAVKVRRHHMLATRHTSARRRRRVLIPNYFWMAVHESVEFSQDLIPDYSGILIVGAGGCAILRKAPRLHTLKLPEDQFRYMSRGVSLRYWQKRHKSK